jgi:DNA-directed RNA polymerase beta subunit
MNKKHPNELHRDLMGVNGLNPWDGHDSSSRKQMFSSHIGQTLVIKGATERFCQTGMEREYAKYTFSVKMPVDAQVIRVIERYPSKIGQDTIRFSPQSIVIYENAETKEIGMLDIRNFCSYHPYFGFEYKPQPGRMQIYPGAFVAKDTIIMDSPSITPDGGYKYGRECNMAFMSMPGVSEDGIVISRDVLKEFAIKTYERRVVDWGSKRFALNLYGDENNYKPFPDIGDRIREDGLLMALRSYDKELSVVEQNVNALREVDFTFDKLYYAAGAGGKIIDIKVQHDLNQNGLQGGMDAQPEKYDIARRQFHQDIVNEYNRLKRDHPQGLQLTPEFHRQVVESLAVVENEKDRIQKLYRQAPLDDWRVEFVIEYEITPTIGFKLTDCHGGKGVICKIAEPHEMPVDENGNRADIVMDPNSTVSRMNLGRLYEQYINAASRDVALKIRNDLHLSADDNERMIEAKLVELQSTRPELIERSWAYLMGYYQIVSPQMFIWFTSDEYKRPRTEHLASIIKKGIYLYMPPDNEPESVEIIKELEKHYRPVYGPVSYIGNSGKRVVTKNPVRIGSMYIIMLEKIGDDWTAVSSGKLQHFGVLSQVTNTDKNSTPSRNQAIRAWGEAEVRIGVSYVGPEFVAEMLDANNNPATHRQIAYTILDSENPTAIPRAVDRSRIPLGGAKPLQLVKHIAECGGWRFTYKPYVPQYGQQQHKQ